MGLIARRKRQLNRRVEHLRDTRLVIIAAEGEVTEAQYFSLFESPRVQVKVLPTGEDGHSSPEYVLERLREYQSTYDLAGDDELWLMIDVDRWGSKKLAQITKEATEAGFGLAISNPCFEVWLLFHHVEHISETDKCRDIEAALRTVLGGSYNKSNLELAKFTPRVEVATEHAVNNDKHPRRRWPHEVGSHVYRVVQRIPKD
jgi:hypothetical protein